MCNAHNALCHRHGVAQPAVLASFAGTWPLWRRALAACRPIYAECPYIDPPVWLSKWSLAKQREIVTAINANERLCPEKCQADVKRECLIAEPTKARLIQYYFNLVTQAAYAPRFYALQKAVTSVLYRFPMGRSDVTFASGLNSRQVAGWMESVLADGAAWFWERDGKCWDATMSETHAALRTAMYAVVDAALAAFARRCVRVKVVYKDASRRRARYLRYSLLSTVKSGHNDTTLGNSLVNAAIALAVLEELGVRGSILVAGDDLLIALYDWAPPARLLAMEEAFGIKPEARMFADPEDVSFTSGIFVRNGQKFEFVPKPGRLLAKLWWTVTPFSPAHQAAYRRGVALGLMPSCGDIPIVRSFLRPFANEGPVLMSNRGYKYRTVGVTGDFEPWFCRRYSTTPAEIFAVESALTRFAGQSVFIVHPLLERIIQVDAADIDRREVLVNVVARD